MSFCYGPTSILPTGTLVTINISQATSNLIIENQSYADLLFSIGPAAPNALTAAQMTALLASGQLVTNGGWNLHIGPLGVANLTIPKEYLTDSPRGGWWAGVLWMQAVPFTSKTWTAGSIVSNPGEQVWVTGYGPGEATPTASIGTIAFNGAQQNREVAVPVTPTMLCSGSAVPGATSTWTNIGNVASIGNFPFSNSAISLGITTGGNFYILVYALNMSMWPLSTTAGTAESQRVLVRVNVQDHTGALVATSWNAPGTPGDGHIYETFLADLALQSAARDGMVYQSPFAVQVTCSAGAGAPYALVPQILVDTVTGGGGTNIKKMSLNMSLDVAGFFVAGPTGGVPGLLGGGPFSVFMM